MDATNIASELEDDAMDLDVLYTPTPSPVTETDAGDVVVDAGDGYTVVVHGANPALVVKLKQDSHHRCTGVEIDQPL